MDSLLTISALIADHINAVAEHDRLFILQDWGLAKPQAAGDALKRIDSTLIAICAARPRDAAAAARRAEYINAKVPEAIYCDLDRAKAVIAALAGGGND